MGLYGLKGGPNIEVLVRTTLSANDYINSFDFTKFSLTKELMF